jgi:hypothetical protein
MSEFRKSGRRHIWPYKTFNGKYALRFERKPMETIDPIEILGHLIPT